MGDSLRRKGCEQEARCADGAMLVCKRASGAKSAHLSGGNHNSAILSEDVLGNRQRGRSGDLDDDGGLSRRRDRQDGGCEGVE